MRGWQDPPSGQPTTLGARMHARLLGLATQVAVAGAFLLGCVDKRSAPPAADEPELFGAGLFSTSAWDFFLAFSADQNRVLFCRANDDFSAYDIHETRQDPAGRWSTPTKPQFATTGSNADPHLTPDGGTVFFISNRPGPGEVGPQATYDIWYATREPDGEWGEGRRLPSSISVPGVDEWSPSAAANGNLYFGTERPGGHGGLDLWIARRVDGVYQAPENLGDSINTAGNEVEPWIAPDESYLIFSARSRADSVGGFDLYGSRRVRGVWEQAHLLAHRVSSPWLDFNQSVSPDGRWLYFSSTRPHTGPLGERWDTPRDERAVAGIGNGKGDMYRIALDALGLVPR